MSKAFASLGNEGKMVASLLSLLALALRSDGGRESAGDSAIESVKRHWQTYCWGRHHGQVIDSVYILVWD